MSQQWKMVPVEPTEEMIHAIALGVHRDIPTAEIWPEVLAVAPQPPALGGEPIKRYDMDQTGCAELDADGVWVRYDDHRACLAPYQAEIWRWKDAAEQSTQKQIKLILERDQLKARVADLEGLLREADDFMYIMTGNDTQRHLDAKYGELMWEDAIEKLRGRVATALRPTEGAQS